MINLNCPVCKSLVSSSSTLFDLKKDANDYQIVSCNKCNHVYTSFEKEIDVQEYYDDKDYKLRDTRKTIFYKIQEKEYKKVLFLIRSFIHSKSCSLLDFGAGKGLFLNFAYNLGYDVKGVETSLPRANYAKQVFGLKISTDNYHKGLIFSDKFDAIAILHVLEHLGDPKNLMQELFTSNLNLNGIAVIEVPNFDSWQSKWGSKYWMHLDIPRHINHFSPKYLKEMLKPLGFTILKEEYFSLHLGVIGMLQSIWSWLGYKGFLIADLKERKNIYLLIKIGLTLPFAFLFEGMAAFFKKGGIIRIYARKTT